MSNLPGPKPEPATMPRFKPLPEETVIVQVTDAGTAEGLYLALQLLTESGYALAEWTFADHSTYAEPNEITFERVY